MLGPRVCARALPSCGKRGPLPITARGPLTIAASPAAEHRLQTGRPSSCGSRAQPLRGTWDPPRPGPEPASPALAGRLPTTAPPVKPPSVLFNHPFFKDFDSTANIFSLSLSSSASTSIHSHQQTCCIISHLMKHLMKTNPPFIPYPSVSLPCFSATLNNKTSLTLLPHLFPLSPSYLPSVSITPLNICFSRLHMTLMLTDRVVSTPF